MPELEPDDSAPSVPEAMRSEAPSLSDAEVENESKTEDSVFWTDSEEENVITGEAFERHCESTISLCLRRQKVKYLKPTYNRWP